MATSTNSTTALKTAAKRKSRKLNKVQKTQNLVVRALAKVEGDFDKLDRKKLIGQMQSKMEMTKGQSSTYFHNFIRDAKAGKVSTTAIAKA
jgi:hypothetical protein